MKQTPQTIAIAILSLAVGIITILASIKIMRSKRI